MCWQFTMGRPTRAHLGRLLAFGWPFGVLYLLGTLRGLDRPLLRALLSIEHVAAYELGIRLVGPVGLFNIALIMVLEPVIYGHSESRDAPALIDRFARGYLVLFATLSMGLALLGPDVVALIAPDAYRDSGRVLPALAFAATCEGFQRIAGIGADLAKRTRVWAAAILTTLAVGFSLTWLLVPHAGLVGAALAWVLANVLSTLLVYRIARAASGIVLPVARGVSLLMLGALAGTAAAWRPWPAPARLLLLVCFALLAQYSMRAPWRALRTLL
jgi:O-antigen/teichoic acid export membrane protein